ncbi:glucoamylase family protein [Nocardioides astragali]|uniref:Glucoamylase family protein n=1 Tax=Nocardioides astragali TaxID=1776736 RepID=A0ABW2N2I5_9ACTN|nr:glucoamylase family protein [Nocardioides astragali]
MRVRRPSVLAAITAATALVATTAAAPSAPAAIERQHSTDARVLERYAADTWRSFEAMTVPTTGLPADNIAGNLDPATRSGFTSPTNIGAYLWSTAAARDIGLIGRREARARMAQTIGSIGDLERHEDSGMFYNWYDPVTGEKLRTFPESGDPIKPFLSSVDNGWLATGLLLAARAEPSLARKADRIREDMNFGCFYNPLENAPAGQIRGGFWDEDPLEAAAVKGTYCGGADVWFTGHHYGAFNTEPRIASYLGITAGQIPARHYFGTYRTFPNDNCDWSWTETRAVGSWAEHQGVRVFEGALPYRGMQIVPTWGGSMFEALMVPLFVPEETWGPRSWGVNHPLYVRGQIEHGMQEADYGYWGFSPSNNPAGGYREYGVDQLGMDGPGYTSDQQRTSVDQPYEGCPGREGSPAPTSYGDGVVTPHASFLALRYARDAALENLVNIRDDFDAYGPGGFYDAVDVGTGTVSKRYLSLDQGMVMAALGNALAGDDMRTYVSRGAMETTLRPLMSEEIFASKGD